jgi:hypothetical protein
MRRPRPLRTAIPGRSGRNRLASAGLAAVALLMGSAEAAAQDPPTITAAPAVSGTPRVGETLTPDAGSWTPPGATRTYQWMRCASSASCTEIAASPEPIPYTVAGADVEQSLLVRLTVTSGTASVSANSEPKFVARAPTNTTLPAVTGTPRDGEVLRASDGGWTGTPPLSFEYQWQRCGPGGGGCAAVAGATSTSYALSSADVGLTVRVRVTASNAGGLSRVFSALTAEVAPFPLANLDPPTIAGVAEVERSLLAQPGRWTPSGGLDFLYRWLRCNADRSDCEPVPGADRRTYVVRLADVGFRLRVRVRAIGDAGSSTADSDLTAIVPAPAGAQDFTQSGQSPSPAASAPAAAALMRPFPRVRIKGFFTSKGAVLRLVTIKGPEGVRIRIACRGRSCPYPHRTLRSHSRVRLRSLQRFHLAGTRILIRITSPGLIGKHTRIIIRAGRPPARRDRCLMPGNRQPEPCPSTESGSSASTARPMS